MSTETPIGGMTPREMRRRWPATVDYFEREARNAALDGVAAKVEALPKLDDWRVVVRRDDVLAVIEGARR